MEARRTNRCLQSWKSKELDSERREFTNSDEVEKEHECRLSLGAGRQPQFPLESVLLSPAAGRLRLPGDAYRVPSTC